MNVCLELPNIYDPRIIASGTITANINRQ